MWISFFHQSIPNFSEFRLKMFKTLIFFYLTTQIFSLQLQVDDKVESCNNGSKPYLNISDVKFDIVSDSETVVNGKMIIMKNINGNWQTGFYGERFDRGEWLLKFQKHSDDFCNEILNPTQLYVPNCR
jgi:hypothetical protein